MADEDAAGPGTGAPGLRAEALPILIVTRFSYLGHSGWKSDASRDAALLYDPARLRQRLALFRAVNLASLAAQTDRDFHHFILTGEALPAWAMAALRAACLAAYGDESRFTIAARPAGRARKFLRQFMTGFAGDAPLVQVVLDDDDGLAVGYMAQLRRTLAQMQDNNPALLAELPKFVSFAQGYALSLRDDAADGTGAALYLHNYPFINLGLAQIDHAGGKNILAIRHQQAPRRFGGQVVRKQPIFVRSVHDFNDSRVARGANWTRLDDWPNDPGIGRDFPWLLAADAPWRSGAG